MYRRIFVPVDGSPTAMAGLDEAIRLAAITGGEIRLLHVLDAAAYASGFETGAVYCNEVVPRMNRAGMRILDEGRERCKRSGVKADGVLLQTVADRVCDLVVAEAVDWGADLLVIGTHGRHGVERLMLGSDAEQIGRKAPVPVLLVRVADETGADGAPAQPGGRRRTAWRLRP